METLLKLTRRKVETLQVIHRNETSGRGVPLHVVASQMHISAPSALGHLTQLEGLGLVSRYRGKTRISEKGRETLVEYQRHHRIAEGLFSRLGLPPETVCAAAKEVDLAISHETIERVCAAEGHPTVCLHGDPIPPCPQRKGG